MRGRKTPLAILLRIEKAKLDRLKGDLAELVSRRSELETERDRARARAGTELAQALGMDGGHGLAAGWFAAARTRDLDRKDAIDRLEVDCAGLQQAIVRQHQSVRRFERLLERQEEAAMQAADQADNRALDELARIRWSQERKLPP